MPRAVKAVFTDLDGTLVHYPAELSAYSTVVAEDAAAGTATLEYTATGARVPCRVLPSLTGGVSYISLRTLALAARLRAAGVVLTIITGARASTYAARRPALPEADYEFFENGGRKLAKGAVDPAWTDRFADALGEVPAGVDEGTMMPPALPPPEDRPGRLWELARELRADGWAVDARDYAANFRVDVRKSPGKSAADLSAALAAPRLADAALASSFNLGKADVYPAGSGKANAARHVLELEGIDAADAVALFDDDNDLELGALVGRSFLPGVTHESVLEAMKQHGGRWVLTEKRGVLGAEEALERVLALHEQGVEAAAAEAAADRAHANAPALV